MTRFGDPTAQASVTAAVFHLTVWPDGTVTAALDGSPSFAAESRMSAPYVVETSGLTKRFGERVAVDNVDLRVPPGLRLGYLGQGAGKRR